MEIANVVSSLKSSGFDIELDICSPDRDKPKAKKIRELRVSDKKPRSSCQYANAAAGIRPGSAALRF